MQRFTLILLSLFAAALARADIVETRDGAHLIGKITKIEGGTVFLSTSFAGNIQIQQAEVTRLVTDEPVSVRLTNGERADGRLSTAGGTVKIASEGKTTEANPTQIAATWAAGAEDPQVEAKRRHWTIQTAADIAGKSGNTESTSIGSSFTAGLVGPQDALKLYGAYQYATTTGKDGVKSKAADELKGGVDYSSFFSERTGWFVRSELERDTVEGVDLRSTSDLGATYRFIKRDKQTLVGRLGVGYRMENLTEGSNERSMVLSSGLNHTYVLSKMASFVTDLQYLPAFEDFSDYRFVHDTAVEVPITPRFWKLRLGVNNSYNSRPVPGHEALDTMYYTRLLLNWK